MEFQRVEHRDNVGVAGLDVDVVGVDRIEDMAGTFIPGSMKDFRIYVSDTYCVDISTAAVGFELKFGHIEFLLYNNTVVNVADAVFSYFAKVGIATTKATVINKVRRHMSEMKNFSRKITRSWHLVAPYLDKNFSIDAAGKKRPVQDSTERPSMVKKLRPDGDVEATERPGNTERHCARCCTQRQHFVAHSASLSEKLLVSRKAVRLLRKRFNTRRVNQELGRKSTLITSYRQVKATLKSENERLSEENRQMSLKLKKAAAELSKWKRIAKRRSEQRNLLKDRIQGLKLSLEEGKVRIDELGEMLTDSYSSHSTQSIRLAGKYDAPFRKCLYACLESQVPVEKAGLLVRYILNELTHISIVKIPAPSTTAQMAYEMGIISDLQLAEALYTAPSLIATLAWDATTIDGSHFNEVNLSFGGKTFTLEIGKLGGGSTLDDFEHIVGIIRNLGTTYSTYSGIQQHLILYKFREMLQTTLTDRAPVNSCVSQQLSQLFAKDLLVLHCNLHPLDGLASEAKKVLRRFDAKYSVNSNTFGKEGKAANLIQAVSKLRHKASTGDPSSFKAFLRLSDLKVGVIVRYVGNRLHILFHSAGVIIRLKNLLLRYLQRYCNETSFRLSLIQDLQQPNILVQLRVLGLFGKMLTGPWMTLIYKNERKMKHLEMIPHVKVCIDKLKAIVDSPENLLSMPTDCFGQTLDTEDFVLRALRNVTVDEVFIEITKELAEGFCKVLQRQLSSYLDGSLSNPDAETVIRTSEAPLHNMHSERALGMFDFQYHRAHNATVGFRDGKVKFVINKTMSWLETKSVEEQQRIVSFARRFAAKRREELTAREKQISVALRERLMMMAQQRDKKQRSQLEKAIRNGTEDLSKIPPERKAYCDLILAKSPTLIGKTLHHVWTNNQVDTVFKGEVTNFQGSNIFILYTSETEATELSVYELVADIILGDASFVTD
ncbi:uncharacterized protein LOC106063498 [Biomphalaria glabrata]|uniref:Uncharacterized protein LOC106063498 n=1 Tax=Biomphalaria glabrata TaxID=6526 RepID=A0A9W2ZZI4_BIOGL|nr:uncharacterized protein LOC106063498 [Biomphalaria glabrata]